MTTRLPAYAMLSLSMLMLFGVLAAPEGEVPGFTVNAFVLGSSSLLFLLLRRGNPVPQRVRVDRPRGKSRR